MEPKGVVEIRVRQDRRVCEEGHQLFKGSLVFSGAFYGLSGGQRGAFGVFSTGWNWGLPWLGLELLIVGSGYLGKVLNVRTEISQKSSYFPHFTNCSWCLTASASRYRGSTLTPSADTR